MISPASRALVRHPLFTAALACLLLPSHAPAQTSSPAVRPAFHELKFTCASPARGLHALPLNAGTRYVPPAQAAHTPAYGFDLVASPTSFTHGACSSDAPFFFSVALPDGNYQVSLTLGSDQPSIVTVRAESRRLFVDRQSLPAHASRHVIFNVNVRSEYITAPPQRTQAPHTGTEAEPAPSRVKLKPREIGALDWDEKLTLEFNGLHPGFRNLSIRPVPNIPTLYLAGDSTVVDQNEEPWAAWGQILPLFFGPRIAIANEAESGETIRSFTSEQRFAKILSTLRPGDFLMIQFAHNDQKQGTPEATGFKGFLARYVEAVRNKGATPILVTSMNRRTFDSDGRISDSLGGYPQAMREFATEQHVPLIDLNASSKTLFEAMGPQGTLKAFVHFPANTFPNQPAELKDDTHFTTYGAYELARAVVQAIRSQHLPLAQYLDPHLPPFDPARPDDPDSIQLPLSPLVSASTPYGK